MSKILFYLFIKPLSLLPTRVLYFISDVIYFFMFHIFGYRKKVVFENLRNSFPEKTEKEIEELGKKFFQHLCDLIIESIRFFSMPKKEACERFVFSNTKLVDDFAAKGQSIVIVAGHYNNWEMASLVISTHITHLAIGLMAPIKNKFFSEKLVGTRSKYGTKLIEVKEASKFIADNQNELLAPAYIADQAPSNNTGHYLWIDFLNQDTPFMIGAEKCARRYGWPVVYADVKKLKRGYYELEYYLLEENSNETKEFDITRKYVEKLEGIIKDKPEYWLWSHKRWKRKRPKS